MTHAELESLLGAYALDAVDPAEAEIIERHLADCPRCRAEVAAHRDTAALLANVGSDAPARVWDAIAANLETAPPPLRLGRLDDRRTRFARVRSAGFAALAAAAAVVVVGLSLRLEHLNRQVAALRAPLQSQGITQAALAAATSPAAHHVVLRADNSPDQADVVVLPSGQSYLVHSDLPSLSPAQTYQLWGIVNGHSKISLALLGDHPSVAAFRLDPAAVSLLAITAEPAPGVATTDNPAVVWAPLTI
jgi:anti-sigma factor RsiW